MSASVRDQLRAALDSWDAMTAYDIGGALGCGEAEGLAMVFRIAGRPEMADELIGSHSKHDDQGDEHWTGEGA